MVQIYSDGFNFRDNYNRMLGCIGIWCNSGCGCMAYGIVLRGERMKNPRVWTEDEYVEIANPMDIDEIVEALQFKAEHITAKADPQVFELAAKTIEELFDTVCYWQKKAKEVSK